MKGKLVPVILALLAGAAALLVFTFTGVGEEAPERVACGGSDCHGEQVDAVLAGPHVDIQYWGERLISDFDPDATLSCEVCHAGALDHAADPENPEARVAVVFAREQCGQCHVDQYTTFTYGDSFRTRYGGSPGPQEPMAPGAQPVDEAIGDVGALRAKTLDWEYYNTLLHGHGFVTEYNEDRSHSVALLDHYNVSRGKFENCLQCKATEVVYYWNSGLTRTVQSEVKVQSGHFAPGQVITIPAGTEVYLSTDTETPHPETGLPNYEVKVRVTLPDGVQYASYNATGVADENNGRKSPEARKMLWAATYALVVDELPEGSSTVPGGVTCNQCHNPHDTQFRVIRQALKGAVSERGVNPYDPAKAEIRSMDDPALSVYDRNILLCAQCHVEYVCGFSPIDTTIRDYFPWRKEFDLEADFRARFDYAQDFLHGKGPQPRQSDDPGKPGYFPEGALYPIGERLIKSQHPEVEFYWQSLHYANATSCNSCHMPRVKLDPAQVPDDQLTGPRKRIFTSHWMASPTKYMTPEPAERFAEQAQIALPNGVIEPCGTCHLEAVGTTRMLNAVHRIQDESYTLGQWAQDALVIALREIWTAKNAGVSDDNPYLRQAVSNYQTAHVLWENLAVSENSKGFHNPSGFIVSMNRAVDLAQESADYAKKARASQ